MLLRASVLVLVAGFIAGWAAGMPVVGTPRAPGTLDTLGKAFVDTRVVTLFVLSLPAIGLCERFGLQARARDVVRKIPAASVGRLQLAYHLFRVFVVAFGIRLGSGHVTFSRPLVVPMALGCAGFEPDEDAPEVEQIKALSAASENFANFFGQNLFFGSSGVALIVKSLEAAGFVVHAQAIAVCAIPMAAVSVLVAAVRYLLFDLWLRARLACRARGEA